MSNNTLSLTVNANAIALPEGSGMEARTNKNAKVIGARMSFIGAKSASQIRFEGKASGLKGKKLDAYVNAALTGDVAAAAWVRHDAIMSGVRSAGAIPLHLDVNAAGTVLKSEYRLTPVDAKADAVAALRVTAEKLVKAGKFSSVEEALIVLA